MPHILGIGIATLDIINSVDGYPAEDTEVRALRQQLRRGGNCTNTLAVLSQLGHRCAWGGVLAAEPNISAPTWRGTASTSAPW
jgi:ketohexokinase